MTAEDTGSDQTGAVAGPAADAGRSGSCPPRSVVGPVVHGGLDDFWYARFVAHSECGDCPTLPEVSEWFSQLLGALFEQHSLQHHAEASTFYELVERLQADLANMVGSAGAGPAAGTASAAGRAPGRAVAKELFAKLPAIRTALMEDADATVNGDPAASDLDEVIRAYPGFVATAAYRIAHELHGLGAALLARILSAAAHRLTGIDVHPAAVIGRRFCIDHGTGVVIGETSVLGDDVKLYQGVTLGGVSVSKADAAKKRHPTIEDRVVIYSGATILGGNTTVGHDSVIGGNVWLTQSVPPFSRLSYRVTAVGVEAAGSSVSTVVTGDSESDSEERQ